VDAPFSITADGAVLHVRLTPKAKSGSIGGMEVRGCKPVIKVHVTAPPEDGKANAALEALIAAWADVPKSAVRVTSGQKSRIKSVSIAGDGPALFKKLSSLLGASSGIPETTGKGGEDG
jgi:uncharacterized protein (TIGR00251 family)